MIQKFGKNKDSIRVFKEFADIADLVYFGNIKDEDDIEPVRGITLTPKRRDKNFIHGTVNGYDVSVLLREAKVEDHKDHTETHTWTIVKIDLDLHEAPHVFVDGHHYGNHVARFFFTKFSMLRNATSVLGTINKSFCDFFVPYAASEGAFMISGYFSDFVMQRMLMLYQRIDVELYEGDLYLYYNGEPQNVQTLRTMLDEALWLAEHFEYVNQTLNENTKPRQLIAV